MKVKNRMKLLICELLVIVMFLPAQLGCAQELQNTSTQTTMPTLTNTTDDNTRVWNPKTIPEAEAITGYDIYTPTYIPADFAISSSIMISRMGFGDNQWKTVTRVWLWKGNRDLSIQLVQNEKPFKIGGGESYEVNGKPGQRAFHQGSAGEPSSLGLAWEQDGFYFSLGGILKDPLTEAEMLKIAASLKHIQ